MRRLIRTINIQFHKQQSYVIVKKHTVFYEARTESLYLFDADLLFSSKRVNLLRDSRDLFISDNFAEMYLTEM